MKNFYFFFFFAVLFVACKDENAPMDTETNKYYADYMAIYSAYDSVGNEGTLKSLDIYLEEFPERHEAYVFKAYVLAKMGKTTEAHSYFNKARDLDGLAIVSYEYQAAYMLHDTTQREATSALIEQGLSIDDSSGHLIDSRAWLNLLNGDLEAGMQDVIHGINMKPKTKNLYRTGFILSSMMEADSAKLFYATKLEALDIDNPTSIDSFLNHSGAYEVLKTLY